MRRINGQAAFALVLLVLVTVYASQIPELGRPFANGVEPGASFLPIILSAIIYVCAIRILLTELRAGARDGERPSGAAVSKNVPRLALIGPVTIILATVMFTAALPVIGYFVSTAVYTFVVALYFNYEEVARWPRSLVMSVSTSAAITVFCWLFFVELFDLNLPRWSF